MQHRASSVLGLMLLAAAACSGNPPGPDHGDPPDDPGPMETPTSTPPPTKPDAAPAKRIVFMLLPLLLDEEPGKTGRRSVPSVRLRLGTIPAQTCGLP